MFLSFLELRNFRNIRAQSINLTRGVTVLWGENGGGKTNLLESIYVLSYLRPIRRGGTSQLITHGAADALLKGTVRSGGESHHISVQMKRGGSMVPIVGEGRPCTFREYLGGLLSVAFVPEDTKVLFGSPQGRRRLLDQSAAMIRVLHLDVLMQFMKCLRQRNRLLALVREGKARETLLDPFDEEMCRLGRELTHRRGEMLARMRDVFRRYFADVDGAVEVDLEGHLEFLEEEYYRRREVDIRRGLTTYGPHRDDFSITIGGQESRFYASQGRKRIISLAFRLSQGHLLYKATGVKPVLLLDDITSEIDPGRRERLLRVIENMGLQTIITTTEAGLMKRGFPGEMRAVKVHKGELL